eukprot:CAMPEP_0117014148 /NCGR_PEP_ID=MMETSP0472-20121206/11533_1 /TAXON_ID=693140 ORGANISM="Tiarina fusus, Strain LIS" /NCGR_SAMPLE_ID=MMETSP0472 /ASSEMBLY_ACC=CAM_ASM_000603 /LENGTH=147 /DNA_ID=CAMNT_0004717637 /DNA_START=114 /DNA_END=557 /DNA_ORIENTATION=-
MSKVPIIAGTMQTDPRSGGVKRSSGVNVLPVVGEVWSQIRDDGNKDLDWVLIGYNGNSKTDMTVFDQGNGGMAVLSTKLPEAEPVFGGVRLSKGRFVHFLYVPEGCPAMKRGRTLMYKNGVFNALEGCDGEIEMSPGLTEETMGQVR